MKTQTFLIRCEYPDGDHIPTQEFVENIQEYFAANIMDGERGRLVVKPVYQPKEEGLAKEGNTLSKNAKLVSERFAEYVNPSEFKYAQDTITKMLLQGANIPNEYILKDENGNVINTQKIVLEKKKKEYPKTYEECCKVLSLSEDGRLYTKGYKASLIQNFQKLYICRDAYWKIAGEEMGLGKPWEPDWNNVSDKYCIYFVSGDAWSKECQTRQCPFAFPSAEMRDAFKENFKSEIEFCKELL